MIKIELACDIEEVENYCNWLNKIDKITASVGSTTQTYVNNVSPVTADEDSLFYLLDQSLWAVYSNGGSTVSIKGLIEEIEKIKN